MSRRSYNDPFRSQALVSISHDADGMYVQSSRKIQDNIRKLLQISSNLSSKSCSEQSESLKKAKSLASETHELLKRFSEISGEGAGGFEKSQRKLTNRRLTGEYRAALKTLDFTAQTLLTAEDPLSRSLKPQNIYTEDGHLNSSLHMSGSYEGSESQFSGGSSLKGGGVEESQFDTSDSVSNWDEGNSNRRRELGKYYKDGNIISRKDLGLGRTGVNHYGNREELPHHSVDSQLIKSQLLNSQRQQYILSQSQVQTPHSFTTPHPLMPDSYNNNNYSELPPVPNRQTPHNSDLPESQSNENVPKFSNDLYEMTYPNNLPHTTSQCLPKHINRDIRNSIVDDVNNVPINGMNNNIYDNIYNLPTSSSTSTLNHSIINYSNYPPLPPGSPQMSSTSRPASIYKAIYPYQSLNSDTLNNEGCPNGSLELGQSIRVAGRELEFHHPLKMATTAQRDTDWLRDRSEGFIQIEEDVRGIHKLYKEMSWRVASQTDDLDSIEAQMRSAHSLSTRAVDEIQQANGLLGQRYKKIIFISLLTGLAAVVVWLTVKATLSMR